MASLAPAGEVVILLPDIPCFNILSINIIDKVSPEFVVKSSCLLLIWSFCVAIIVQGSDGQVVDVNPYWPPPVGRVMFCVSLHVQRISLGERTQAIECPQLIGVSHVTEDMF